MTLILKEIVSPRKIQKSSSVNTVKQIRNSATPNKDNTFLTSNDYKSSVPILPINGLKSRNRQSVDLREYYKTDGDKMPLRNHKISGTISIDPPSHKSNLISHPTCFLINSIIIN